jgi:membrane associated rhomboid family serine protease
VWFYLISGVFAGIIYALSAYLGMLTAFESVFGSYEVMAVGASGALFGLVGILAVLIPKKRVYLIIGPIIVLVLDIILSGFLTGGMGTLISVFLNILMFLMIFSIFFPSRSLNKLAIPVSMPMWAAPIAAIVPLVAISLLIELPIGNSAHIGGLIAGLIYGAYLIKRYKKKVSILRNIIR